MKKFLLILTSIILFTSGCVKQNDEYTITIDNNNNVTLSEVISINKKSLKKMGNNFNNSESFYSNQFETHILNSIKKARNLEGFDNSDYEDDEYIGFMQTKKNLLFSDIKPKDLMPGLTSVLKTPITVNKGVFKDTYKIHLKYNYQKAYDEICSRMEMLQQESQEENYSHTVKTEHIFIDNQDGTFTIKDKYNADGFSGDSTYENIPNPNITLTIKLPTKANKHNADKVIEDNEYQWDLFVLNSDVDINLEYTKQSDNLPTILTIGSLVLLLIGLWYFYIKNVDNIW